MNTSKFLFLIIFTIIFIHAGFAQDVGDPYTDFTGTTVDGTPVKLSSLAGKVIFLDFWASWCKPCKEEFPYLVTLYNDYKDSGFVVVAVNVDNEKSKLESFIANLGVDVPFTVISDTEGKLPELYKLDAMPTSFIIDKKGIIKYKHTGFELSDKQTYVKEITGLLNAN
jgi:peroxiredoxin